MQGNLTGSPLAADIGSVRNATNLRTVSRNDPAVTEILDTSTYSVIYHYDADAAKWQKQKQEGSLFVVRRSKAPEYALFLLNRVTVKNVTIPLIPGEMKATAIDASMLQVARRGEKIRYGIWFTEGTEGVQRFRDTIVSVCGEPSKTSAASRGSPMPPAPTPGSAPNAASTNNTTNSNAAPPTGADGLSRLFASMTTVPAARSSNQSSPQPQPPQSHTHTPQSMPSQATPQSQQAQYGAPPMTGYSAPGLYASNPVSAPLPGLPGPVPVQQQQPPAQAQAAANYPPGQTVDDLLMSILGPAAPPPPGPGPAPMHVGLGNYSTSTPPIGMPPHPGFHPGPHPGASPMPVSGPCGPGPISNYCAPHPSSSAPPPVSAPNSFHGLGAPQATNGTPSPVPPPPGGNDPGVGPIRDAVAKSIPTPNSSTPPPVVPAPPDFRAYLADLVMAPNNAWFVDQVFASYTQNLDREAKKKSQPQNQNQNQNGPKRGGNRPQRGRNQQQQQH